MEYLAVYASRLEGTLKSGASLAQIFLRPINNGKIGKSYEETEFGRMPLIWTGMISHEIISLPLRGRDEIDIHSKVRELKDYVICETGRIKAETEEEIERTKEGTKKHKTLEEKLELSLLALNNSSESFNAEFVREGKKGAFYSLTLPPIKKSTQKLYLSRFFDILAPYNSPTTTIQRHLQMPYSIIDIDSQGKMQITGKKPSYEMIKESGLMAIDAETHNWKNIELAKELKLMEHKDIAIIYLESHGMEQKDITSNDIRKAMQVPKIELIKRIEAHANQNKGEMLTLITLNSDDFTGLISYFENSETQYSFEDPITGKRYIVNVGITNNSENVGTGAAQIISEQDPLVLTGHNQTGFDYNTIRMLSKDSFPIGVNDSNPRLKHKMPGDFIEVHDIIGRDSIDPAYYFMFHERTWSNNLDEVTMFLHSQSQRKSMSHIELLLYTEEALQGDKDRIKAISDYGWSDGQKSLHNARVLLREIYAASLLYGARMIEVSTTSPKTLALDFWIDDFVNRGLMPYHTPTFHSLNQMNFSEESRYLFRGMHQDNRVFYKNFDRQRMLERIVGRMMDGKDKARGTHEGILLSINPFLYSLMPVFERIPALKEAYDKIGSLDDNYAKARLLNHIENVLDVPLFDILSETRQAFRRKENTINPDSEARFKENYDADISIKELSDRVHEQYLELFDVLGKENILTLRDNYVIIPSETNIKLDRINALLISEGTVHIGAPKEFIFNSGSRRITSGISNPRQNKGLKSGFERETLSEFYTLLVNESPSVALEYLHGQLKESIEGRIDSDYHIYEKTASKNFSDYSPNARGMIIEAHTKNKVMKGEKSRISFEDENLAKKLEDRFSHPLVMAIGQVPELLKNRKLKKKILSGSLSEEELSQIMSLLE